MSEAVALIIVVAWSLFWGVLGYALGWADRSVKADEDEAFRRLDKVTGGKR